MKFLNKRYFNLILAGIILIIAYKLIDNLYRLTDFFSACISVFLPVIIGIVIAFFTYRPSKLLAGYISKINNRFIKRKALTLSVITVYVSIAAALAVFSRFIIPVLVSNIQDFVEHIPEYYDTILNFVQGNKILSDFIKNINISDIISIVNTDTINWLISTIGSIANSFISFFIGIIFSVYFILYKDRVVEHLRRLKNFIFRNKKEIKFLKHARKIVNLFYSYFIGLSLDAILIGTLTAIILSLFKVPYAFLLGLIVAFGNMIPFFGAIVASIIVYVVCALTYGPVSALWVLLLQIVLGQVDANIIQPRIIGHSVGVSPLTVLLTVIILGELFGPLGMILGVPIVAAIKLVIYGEN